MTTDIHLESVLESLSPTPAIDGFVRSLVASRNLESRRRADYLSLRPVPVGAVAVYCHAALVSIAVDRDKAVHMGANMPYAALRPKSSATTYIIVRDADLAQHSEQVLQLAIESADWRAVGAGARSNGVATARHEVERETCPNCWTEVTPAGGCWCE